MTTSNIHDGVRRFIASIEGAMTLRELIPLVIRMTADGTPVTVEEVAAAGGWQVGEVRAELAKFSQLQYDEQGRVTALHTYSSATPHKFSFDGTTLYGCASDTLIYPVILGRAGVVESACPVTGRPIRIELTPTEVVSVDPPQTVVSKVRPTEGVTDMVTQICGLGMFFSSREAAADWLARNPTGFVDTVADDFEIHRQGMLELGWQSPAR